MQNRTLAFIVGFAFLLTGCGSFTMNSSKTGSAAKLTITTSTLPGATVGTAYSSTVAASGGTTPYMFSATGLPGGLTINGSTGAITGTPAQSAVGTASVVVTATDTSLPQQSAKATLSLVVTAAQQANTLTIATTSLPNGTIGAPYNATITVTGGSSPFTFSATGLPSGLAINATTGTISGTPNQSTPERRT